MKALGELTFTIILTALLAPLGGLVLSYSWEWFIVPVFDFRGISIVEAIGISFTINLLVKPLDRDKSKKKKTPKERGEEFGFKLAVYLIAWGLGFIIHLFL